MVIRIREYRESEGAYAEPAGRKTYDDAAERQQLGERGQRTRLRHISAAERSVRHKFGRTVRPRVRAGGRARRAGEAVTPAVPAADGHPAAAAARTGRDDGGLRRRDVASGRAPGRIAVGNPAVTGVTPVTGTDGRNGAESRRRRGLNRPSVANEGERSLAPRALFGMFRSYSVICADKRLMAAFTSLCASRKAMAPRQQHTKIGIDRTKVLCYT